VRDLHNKKLKIIGLIVVGIVLASVIASSRLAIKADIQYDTAGYANQTISLVNTIRTQQGQSQLTVNNSLMNAAQTHAADMAARNYYSHNSPEGKTPIDWMHDAGYTGGTWSENIAAGYITPQENVTAWQNSTLHYANMLKSDFNITGVGVARSTDGQGRWYYVQMFGAGTGITPPATNTTNSTTSSSIDTNEPPSTTITTTDNTPTPIINPDYSRTYFDPNFDPNVIRCRRYGIFCDLIRAISPTPSPTPVATHVIDTVESNPNSLDTVELPNTPSANTNSIATLNTTEKDPNSSSTAVLNTTEEPQDPCPNVESDICALNNTPHLDDSSHKKTAEQKFSFIGAFCKRFPIFGFCKKYLADQSTPSTSTINTVETGDLLLPVPVQGDLLCKQQTSDAMKVLQKKAQSQYQMVANSIHSITCYGGDALWGAYITFGDFDVRVYNNVHGRSSTYYAGFLVHEAQHAQDYKNNKPYSGREGESRAFKAQYDALVLMDAPFIEVSEAFNSYQTPPLRSGN
jgi:uncharacterized protein YkwD